jgi:hypothetical protein
MAATSFIFLALTLYSKDTMSTKYSIEVFKISNPTTNPIANMISAQLVNEIFNTIPNTITNIEVTICTHSDFSSFITIHNPLKALLNFLPTLLNQFIIL